MAKSIIHFSHPQHELVWTPVRGPNFRCDMCSSSVCSGSISMRVYRYRCATCNFDIHETCAEAKSIIHFSHPQHKLAWIPVTRPCICDVCHDSISTSHRYHCAICDFDIHDTCAKERETKGEMPLPKSITHFSHPQHELVSTAVTGRCTCDMCFGDITESHRYRCATCNFDIHETCAEAKSIIHFSHTQHKLAWIPVTRPCICDVCHDSISTSHRYRCAICNFDIHETCAKERETKGDMSKSITHFSHPQHKLVSTVVTGRCTCDMCFGDIRDSHRYRCDTCNFDVHETCANFPLTMDNFYAHHWHSLSIMHSKGARICDLCTDPVNGLFYRCVACEFDMHLHCSLLPQTVKTDKHSLHSLTLVPSLVKCSACGERKGAWHYVCGFCQFRLDVKCLNDSSASTGEENKMVGNNKGIPNMEGTSRPLLGKSIGEVDD